MIIKKISPKALSLAVLFGIATVGCTSVRMDDREPDRLFAQGQFKEAAAKLKKGLDSHGENHRDALLYQLDLALALHMAGDYAESTKVFLRADRRAEAFDYTSFGEEASTLLVSDNTKPYKTEDFEYVLISTYLAMNFALNHQTEDALVEVRRVNRKLLSMISEGKKKYKLDVFARYLSGILYEAEGEYEDALLDYKATHELMPEFTRVGEDLYRMAIASRRKDEALKYKSKFEISDDRANDLRRMAAGEWGEAVVIFQNGISPIKRPHPQFHSVPEFKPRMNPVTIGEVFVDGEKKTTTYRLKDVESTAIQNLEEKWAGVIAKKVAGLVVKGAAGEAVGGVTGSRDLGEIVKIVLWATDQADLRSWNLLPKEFQIARIPLTEGQHTIRVKAVGGAELTSQSVEIKKGQIRFLNFRYSPQF